MTEPSLRDQLQASLGTAYTIQRELGGGGMSRVFLARDESLGRDIVIKVLPQELAAEMSVSRFTREIKLAAGLQNPHVLPLLSAGVADGLPYYMMPYVRGESLREAMDAGTLDIDEKLGVLRDVARALRYAHREGVVHRDIKPENILLSSGSAVVVDFGIAKALSASRTEAPGGTLTVVGTSIGTPAYMSPEQAAADPNIDHRADIYAWGVVAYELLSGKHPFHGKVTPQQFLAAHLAESPPPLRKLVPTMPAAFTDVVMRTLEKDPNKRPQTADDLIVQFGGPSKATLQAVPISIDSKWRIPVFAGVVLLVLAGGFALWRNRGDAKATDAPVMLAVLPFENQGPPEQDYFVDGLTDAVNGKLAGLSGISVIDRRSTASYRKTTKPVQQIGNELGVQYVLGGVVRWAKNGGGWRAQVMPTLVSTRDATTRWAGEPVVVSSEDPFTAQTEIATRVAGALQLALGADERRDLAARPTQNADAYDAFLRGKSILFGSFRASPSVRDLDRASAELRRAVTLDPKFAQAWAFLAGSLLTRAYEVPGDSASTREAFAASRRAEELDPDDPQVANMRSGVAWNQGDPARAIRIVREAVNRGLIDPDLLVSYAFDLFDNSQADSANAVMARAVRMNPRYAETRVAAADLASLQKDWAGMERNARALISIDPLDERGWAELAQMGRNRGDSLQTERALEEAFKHIRSPSNLLLVSMVYASDELGSQFVRMTPERLRIETLYDSVATYYDNKADFYLRRGDLARARIYHDSIIQKLEGRNISGRVESELRAYLANAYMWTGRMPEARRELDRVKAAALANGRLNSDGSPQINRRVVGAVLGALARHDEAQREFRLLVRDNGWTRAGLALEPKLRHLRNHPAYAAFWKEPE